MDDTALLMWGMLFSSIGMGYFIYGKKQQEFVPLICGCTLCIYPYFISNVFLIVIIGLILMVVPIFIKL